MMRLACSPNADDEAVDSDDYPTSEMEEPSIMTMTMILLYSDEGSRKKLRRKRKKAKS